MRTIILTLFLLGSTFYSFAQDSEWIMKGFLGINQSSKATYLTMGGPGITLSKGETEFALRLLPAIRFDNEAKLFGEPTSVVPSVGGGFQTRYKNFVLNLPIAYYAFGRWEFAMGIGYVFKPKKK